MFYPGFGVYSKHREKHQIFTYLEEAILVQGIQGFTILNRQCMSFYKLISHRVAYIYIFFFSGGGTFDFQFFSILGTFIWFCCRSIFLFSLRKIVTYLL